MIYFNRYDWGKPITVLKLHYHKLLSKIEEKEGKNLMIDDYVVDNVLDRIK